MQVFFVVSLAFTLTPFVYTSYHCLRGYSHIVWEYSRSSPFLISRLNAHRYQLLLFGYYKSPLLLIIKYIPMSLTFDTTNLRSDKVVSISLYYTILFLGKVKRHRYIIQSNHSSTLLVSAAVLST